MRRGTLIGAITTLIAGLSLPAAEATFPGENGPILFRHVDFQTGLGRPLFRAQPDGSEVMRVTNLPGLSADWRADGSLLAIDVFERNGDVQVATIDPSRDDLRMLTSGRGIHEAPTWSPNGRRIAFDFSRETDPSSSDFETRLWVMRADGGDPRPLAMDSKGFDVEPRFSPDGRSIAFGRLRVKDGRFEQAAHILDLKSHEVRRLTPWRFNAEHPTWSPDSSLIVYNSPEGTVQTVRRDGRNRKTVLPAERRFGAHKPWFSPDGSKLLFMCENWGTLNKQPKDYNEDLCVAAADGSGLVNITNTPKVFENYPSWGPAG